jgi:hypothetical protein
VCGRATSLFFRTACSGFFAIASALSACSDEDCLRLTRCNVRERDCQRSVMKAVACMRGGGDGELPAVRVLSEAEFIERGSSDASDDEASRAEREARYALWTRGLSLFDLAPDAYAIDDAIAESAAVTGAAYFHETREIVIIDRGTPLSDVGAVEMLAHEVVHALQDQELDLTAYEERWATSFDASLALHAVIEGEAVHYQLLAAVELAERDPSELDWEHLYTDWRSETLLEAEADAAPVALAHMRFPYAFGGGFVTQHWLARGRGGIDALLDDPPRTSSQVMFGSDPSVLAAERETLSQHAVPALAEQFTQTTATELGAWIMRMFAARTIPEVGPRLRPARELAADVFSVQHDPSSDALVAAWRSRTIEASALSLPALERDGVIRQLDMTHREVYAIAGDPELPQDAAMFAWRAAESDAEPEMQTASAAWQLIPGPSHYRACAQRRPRF